MPTIKELRGRIRSLKNTSKITSAMKMVSAAKLRKAQDAHNRTAPYFQKLQEMIERVSASLEELNHPLLENRGEGKTRYGLISSDRGLCGSFNNGLFKYFQREKKAVDYEVIALGRRAKDFTARNQIPRVSGSELMANLPTLANAAEIAENLMSDFLSGKVDKVVLVYNRFNSVISQTPMTVPLLPVSNNSPVDKTAEGTRLNYIFEPDGQQLIDTLLPKMVVMQVFRALLENAAGEHGARMTAMDSATKNTKDLIGSLTLTMNRARQAAITKELIEIVSGAESLHG